MFGTLASHAHFLTDSLQSRYLLLQTRVSQHVDTATGRNSPRWAHLCARLQPLVHLVDPILRLDHVGRVSPVEGSKRRRVERVVGWVGHGGSWRCARRGFSVRRARQRTWECDALQRPPVGYSRCRGWAALCKLVCLVHCYSVELEGEEEEEQAEEREKEGEEQG